MRVNMYLDGVGEGDCDGAQADISEQVAQGVHDGQWQNVLHLHI